MSKEEGYQTTIEHTRHYIDTMYIEGGTVKVMKKNKLKFQRGILEMQIAHYASLKPEDIVFLDRAITDVLAYYRFLELEVGQLLKKATLSVNYKKNFILDGLPLINDHACLESEKDQIKIHNNITQVYESLPFPVIHIPVLEPEKRVNFILNNL